jgi:hypothetical protein
LSWGRQILSVFIDDKPLSEFLFDKTNNPIYKGLWSAWLISNNKESEYIHAILNSKENRNIPILLCPDDMDFWCTVIVAKVQFHDDIVVWEKIGVVVGKINVKQWRESGIQDIYKWSEKDWELYGGTLAWLNSDDKEWKKWCSENWHDEEMRRMWNYFDQYLNDDANIEWIDTDSLTFSIKEFEYCIEAFKQFKY